MTQEQVTKLAGRYFFACQPCYEEHAAECRSFHGLHREE